jgi:hypothetical protein
MEAVEVLRIMAARGLVLGGGPDSQGDSLQELASSPLGSPASPGSPSSIDFEEFEDAYQEPRIEDDASAQHSPSPEEEATDAPRANPVAEEPTLENNTVHEYRTVAQKEALSYELLFYSFILFIYFILLFLLFYYYFIILLLLLLFIIYY